MANYKIEDLEGVSEVMGQKFRKAGIKDTDILLFSSKKPAQRKDLADKTGISDKKILKFANMVDLYRINGIGSEYSELLEAAGVDTVPDLARRNPKNLAQKMAEVNEVKKLARRIPTENEITKWVDQAKKLPRILEY